MQYKLYTLILFFFVSIYGNSLQAQYCTPHFLVGCMPPTDANIHTLSIIGEGSGSIYLTAPGCPLTGYTDLTTDTITFNSGITYYGHISTDASPGLNVQMYIDFNDNGIFELSETVAGMNVIATYPDSSNFSISIPASASAGAHRMRVIITDSADAVYPAIDPCAMSGSANYTYGAVHDYTVLVESSCPPAASSYINGITSTSAVASIITTPTTATATTTLQYQYLLDTTTSFSAAIHADTAASLYFTGLTPSTTYYFFVRDSCPSGGYSAWVTDTFTTYPVCPPPFSIATFNILDSSASISWVPNNVSSTRGYEYAVNLEPTDPITPETTGTTDTVANIGGLIPFTKYYIHVRDSCADVDNFSAWIIDSFTTLPPCTLPVFLTTTNISDSGATLAWTTGGASGDGFNYAINASVGTPPATYITATDTFIIANGLTPSTTYYIHVRDSCGPGYLSAWVTSSFTTQPLPCPGPVLTASSISDSSAAITWLSFTGGAMSNGSQYIINTSATDTAGTTIATTDTFIHATGLLPATTYYVHVRDSCVPTGNFSFWSTLPVTTLTLCTIPSLLMANSVTDSSAIINWYLDSTSLGLGYQYVIDTSAGDPTISGTATTDSFVNAGGLNPATTYYVHVRDSCGPGYLSAWVTISFTTLPLPCPLPLIAADSISDSSAVITWTTDSTGATSTGYQYTVNTSAASPSGSGTATADTVANATGLLPGTVYYAHVRDSCGPGDFSAWVTTSFTTLPLCLPPTAVSASGISYTTATINWTGSSGYSEFQVNAAAADTTGISSVTTTTSASIAGLLPGTTYYFHVRDSCGPGDYSAWITISFTTADESVANTNNPLFSVTTYPNPAKSIVNVRIAGKQTQKAGAVITDINGKIITTVDVTGDTFSIDLSTYPVGIYVLRYTDSLHTQTVKITKE